MAAMFQSLRSSSMPKRLLRYALSRLDILDAETLDMENLDLAIGRNTVVEFRDVGIILKKLQSLLSLPPSFKLQKAKILLLRVTLPMDFYTNPIVINVDGVDIRVQVVDESLSSKGARSSRRTKHAGTEEDDQVVPNPVDLAQSFLETQPADEKANLQRALAAESQDLGASVSVASDDGSDDEMLIGTGQPLSLPTFLADFLQGIIDRTQVRIRSVNFQLDMTLPIHNLPDATPELVSFQIGLDSVDVEGVTTPNVVDDSSPQLVHKEGKRHVSLSGIRAFLVSEANVFSAYAQSPTVSSPTSSEHSQELRSSQTSAVSSVADLNELAELEGIDDLLMQDSEIALNIPYDFSSQPGDNDEDGPATPRASIYQDMFPDRPQPGNSRSAIVGDGSSLWASYGRPSRETQSEPNIAPFPTQDDHDDLQEDLIEFSSSGSRTASSPTGSLGPHGSSPPVDLAQSHIYTHEEAESMYLSAFSSAQSQSTRSVMPGAWEDSPSPELRPRDVAVPAPELPESLISDTEPPLAAQEDLLPQGYESLSEIPKPSSPIVTNTPELPEPDASESTLLDPEATANDDVYSSQYLQQSLTVDAPASEAETSLATDGQEASPPAAHEDIATPRGPTRLVKEILTLDNISVHVPLMHHHIYTSPQLHPATMNTTGGASMHLPGAFSVHSHASGLPADSVASLQSVPPSAPPASDDSLEITLSPVEVRFDASLGFLLATAASKLLEVLNSALKEQTTTTSSPGSATPSAASAGKSPDIKLFVEMFSIQFLSNLKGVADTAERTLDPSFFQADHDVLLRLDVTNIEGLMAKPNADDVETTLSLGKVRFGYANDDILSFNRAHQMRASVRDVFPPDDADVFVKIAQSKAGSRTQVTTLPVHIHIDLQRIDDVFGWFGGLSSFLNMGSSISSVTSTQPRLQPPMPPSKPRGVRFDTPINPNDQSDASSNKIDMRIGGFYLRLQGKEHNIGFESSTIKMVKRDEGVGIAMSAAKLSGPYANMGDSAPSIRLGLDDIRLEYATSPKDRDLDKLLELITPSKVKFDEGDEIMVDTLLRQRRKGSVFRVRVDSVSLRVGKMHQLSSLSILAEEAMKLATVAKYLPEDDRPGLLTFGQVKNMSTIFEFGGRVGKIQGNLRDLELAHITIPSLVALSLGNLRIERNGSEELVYSPQSFSPGSSSPIPVVMARMIGGEIEPLTKIKLNGLAFEYRVPMVMDFLGLAADATPQDFEASLAASVVNLGEQAHTRLGTKPNKPKTVSPAPNATKSKPMTVEVSFHDCLVGLNPLGLTSKMQVVLTDSQLRVSLPEDDKTTASLEIKRAAALLVDDVSALLDDGSAPVSRRRHPRSASQQVAHLCSRGFVDICYISATKATVQISPLPESEEKRVEVEFQDDLFVLETCADSTQTLLSLVNALKPPTPPSKEIKYRTKVMPVQDLLASISAEAFGKAEGNLFDFDNDFAIAQELAGSQGRDVDDTGSEDAPLMVFSNYYEQPTGEKLFDADSITSAGADSAVPDAVDDGVLLSFSSPESSARAEDSDSDLAVNDEWFRKGPAGPTALVWNSARNSYDQAPVDLVRKSPLRISVRKVHLIWNLFDGYDWVRTKDVIAKAVHGIETRLQAKRSRNDRNGGFEDIGEDDEDMIDDFLFNSIYIGIPSNRDARDLSQAINNDINDQATETESVATTSFTATTARPGGVRRSAKHKLRLNRGSRHKIAFELQGVDVDMIVFPPGSGETESSIDVRVQDLDVFDHIPTSTWKKFATYDQDAGEREMDASMVHLELLNVRPVTDLPASEIVLRLQVLPLRLHVDQDALDFITRFFEFKDENAPIHSSPSDVPFIQRAEVLDIPVKLDFKPKRVDYAGLRSGRTTEFMNFIVLEEAKLVLRKTISYGVPGFDRLGILLNNVWTPDVRQTQLTTILAGLAPVHSLVNIGSGFRDLVEIPIKEYRRDGRIIRGISKGAIAFLNTTGKEVVKLGAKVAVGTQYALQGAEGLLTQQKAGASGGASSSAAGTSTSNAGDEEDAPEEQRQISLYADQPVNVIQGLRGGYASLARDLNVTRDAIIAIPGEVMESQNAQGVARAVLRRAPTIIFRPAIGASKAIGQTLMGATNSLDPQNLRRAEQKYKRH